MYDAVNDSGAKPALSLITYLDLAAASVGKMRAELDKLRAEVERASDATAVVSAIPSFEVATGYTALGSGQEVIIPPGAWQSAIVLWPDWINASHVWNLLDPNLSYAPPLYYVGSSGYTQIVSSFGLAAVQVFGDTSFKLYAMRGNTNMTANPVTVIFSEHQYWHGWSYYGY